jgi:hypothetical protein
MALWVRQTYDYTRSYLEVDDRVQLLNSRLSVIRDLLDVLNAQVADSNSNRLEWIVVWLITVEIIMGIWSNPLFAGNDDSIDRSLNSLFLPSSLSLTTTVYVHARQHVCNNAGKRLWSALLVPTVILAYKKVNWSVL